MSQQSRKVFIIEGCIICKTCEFTDPSTFEVPESGLSARVLQEEVGADRWPAVREAIKLCPVHVIKAKKINS